MEYGILSGEYGWLRESIAVILDVLFALDCTAQTRKLSIVVRLTIVAGEFFAGANIPPSVKLNAVVRNSNEDVRITRVIYKLEWIVSPTTIDRASRAEFDDGDSLRAVRTSAGFADGDLFAGKIANLLAGANGSVSK